MTKTSLLASALALALAAACGGGGDDASIESFFPASDEYASWVEDTSVGGAGVSVARSNAEAEALVDGDARTFISHGFLAFAWQSYAKGALTLDVRVWEMADAAAATAVYDDLVVSDTLYSTNTWEPVAVGEAGRIANTGVNLWVNARKSAYHVEAKINQNDAAARTEVTGFVTEVLGRIP